ncbi:hypothetical protein M2280_006103 [Prescottella agglutinans]|uniref:Uncharacterized protein n=1 Tax=Prescottella agglutinans TaxID=1644129 RepID=A0ABT6MLK2_9NOCA|nr:hypothetical protein [Prescottella agglutinans]
MDPGPRPVLARWLLQPLKGAWSGFWRSRRNECGRLGGHLSLLEVMVMDFPLIYWFLFPPFFDEWTRVWITEHAPCWLGGYCY